MNMRVHRLKTWPVFFELVRIDRKKAEVRKADRDFRVGDYLLLLEFDPSSDRLTGRSSYRRITHILTPTDPPRGLMDGFVVLSMEDCESVEIEYLQGQYTGSFPRTVETIQPAEPA